MLKTREDLESILIGAVKKAGGIVGVAAAVGVTLGTDYYLWNFVWDAYKNSDNNPAEHDYFPLYFFTAFSFAAVNIVGYAAIKKILLYTHWVKPEQGPSGSKN